MPFVMRLYDIEYREKDEHTVGFSKKAKSLEGVANLGNFPCVYSETEEEGLDIIRSQLQYHFSCCGIKDTLEAFAFRIKRCEVKDNQFWGLDQVTVFGTWYKLKG